MRKTIAAAACAILIVGSGMLVNGSHLAARRSIARLVGPSSLPAQSEFIRRIYAQPAGNDADSLDRTTQALDLAGRHDLAMRLTRFFAYCNMERLRGEDDACTRESVRSAVSRNDIPASDATPPLRGDLASDLDHALSFSLATEQQLRDGIQSPGFWEYHRYDGPGVLTYDNPTRGAFIFLAVRNRSRWEVARFKARLELKGKTAGAMELQCDRNPFPFSWPHPFAPGTEVLRVCQADSVKLSDLLAAVHQLQHSDSLPIRLDEFELKEPYVRISIEDDGAGHQITLQPVHEFTSEFIPNTATATSRLPQELNQVSCQELSTCPSTGESASLALYDFFFPRNYLALPLLAGVLMGVGIGGLIRRSLLTGGIIAAAVVVCTIAIVAVSFQSSAMLAYGLTVIAIGAVPLWLLGFFLGVLLLRPLHRVT